jgi:hypothetical protein
MHPESGMQQNWTSTIILSQSQSVPATRRGQVPNKTITSVGDSLTNDNSSPGVTSSRHGPPSRIRYDWGTAMYRSTRVSRVQPLPHMHQSSLPPAGDGPAGGVPVMREIYFCLVPNGAQWFRRVVKEPGWCPVKQYCTEGDPLRHEEYGLFRGPDRNIEIRNFLKQKPPLNFLIFEN